MESAEKQKKLMWTLEDWGMLLDHHLTEVTSKHCMFYMGESILKLESKQLVDEVKTFKITETNEAALKDWAPLQNRDLEKELGKPTNGKSRVYSKIKGTEVKTVITLTDSKYAIDVEVKGKDLKKALLYNWELALLMDSVIATFVEGKSSCVKKDRLTKAMELLCTIDHAGVKAVRQACNYDAFHRLIRNMCVGMKNPFIAKKNEKSDFNRCVCFWKTENGGDEAIKLDKKMMMAALRAVAMGLKAYPLHAAIECNDLNAVVLLLANGVDPNAKNEKGTRPLYDALQNGYVNIVKALLLFGADPKKDVAKRITFQQAIYPDMKQKFEEVLKIVDDKFEYPPVKMEEFEKRRLDKAIVEIEKALSEGADIQNLLSLDGGGIRGLVLIEILDALEKKYGPNLLHRFRWVAGTSTGAILAVALGQGKDVAECRRLYFRLKDLVFYRSNRFNPYPVAPLEKFLQREFGEDTLMKSIDNGASKDPQRRKKNVVVTTADCSESTAKLKLFRNFNVPDQTKKENDESLNHLAWEAIRSSSAAPTYFPPVARRYVDGGLIANNPVLPLLKDFVSCQEAVTLGLGSAPAAKPAKLGIVLSLGTGLEPIDKVKQLKVPQLGNPESCSPCIFSVPRYVKDAANTCILLLKGISNQIFRCEDSVNSARDWAFSLNGAFFRFNRTLNEQIELDETNNVKLIDLLWKTRVHMRKQKTFVDTFVNILHKTTTESDGKRSMATYNSREPEPVRRFDDGTSLYAEDKPAKPLTEEELAEITFLKSARDEIKNDPNVQARVHFFEVENMPLALSPDYISPEQKVKLARAKREMDKTELELSNKAFLKSARDEMMADPKVKARAHHFEVENMPIALSPDYISPEQKLKLVNAELELVNKVYLKSARDELAADRNVQKRATFFENDRLPLAIEPEEGVKRESTAAARSKFFDIDEEFEEVDAIAPDHVYENVPTEPAKPPRRQF